MIKCSRNFVALFECFYEISLFLLFAVLKSSRRVSRVKALEAKEDPLNDLAEKVPPP